MSSDIVIQVENLSKQYRLGEVSTGSLHHDINRWWHKVRGLPDPYLSVTGENIRTGRPDHRPQTADHRQHKEGEEKSLKSKVQGLMSDSDYVWALKDINFEVKRGEVLGVIGRNGAGKSTLLKIMSRITAPTVGEVRVKGRIGALLEVGTGFHQDLTGRENIYLNGAVLGMTKAEVSAKLDEIVEFSGCARYIDTPVKRYSSGMVVRLGFAVAAHLEPEILIVDEVLAVGDAEFQKKCIGKMQDVASHGRTVLFVSHNMASIESLCSSCILLEGGIITGSGETREISSKYLVGVFESRQPCDFHERAIALRDQDLIITNVALNQKGNAGKNNTTVHLGEDAMFEISYQSRRIVSDVTFFLCLYNQRDEKLALHINTRMSCGSINAITGAGVARCKIPTFALVPGEYRLDVGVIAGKVFMDREQNAMNLHVAPADFFGTGYNSFKGAGSVLFAHTWEFE